jgi:hypothetical protein
LTEGKLGLGANYLQFVAELLGPEDIIEKDLEGLTGPLLNFILAIQGIWK